MSRHLDPARPVSMSVASGFCDGFALLMPLPFSMTVLHAIAGSRTRAVPREEAPVVPSFRDVYDAYFDFVWASARRLGVQAESIDDVVQDVFIVVHTRLKTIERPASLRSWMYGVVRRTVSDYHRRRNRRTARESSAVVEEMLHPMRPDPLDLAMLGDELKLLWHLLAELDPLKREVLMLAELEEMTAPEIAEAVGIPLNTAYSRLRVARQEFNDVVARALARERPRK